MRIPVEYSSQELQCISRIGLVGNLVLRLQLNLRISSLNNLNSAGPPEARVSELVEKITDWDNLDPSIVHNQGAARSAGRKSKVTAFDASGEIEGVVDAFSETGTVISILMIWSIIYWRENNTIEKTRPQFPRLNQESSATIIVRFFSLRCQTYIEFILCFLFLPSGHFVSYNNAIMLKSARTNLILAFIAVSIASDGAYAAPLPRFFNVQIRRKLKARWSTT